MNRYQAQPFFVNVWLNDTHATLDPDEKQLEPYEHLMPVGLRGKHTGANAIYYAVVTEADRQIGRLLNHLDALELRENTVLVFSADNGPEDIAIRNASHSGVGSPGPFRGRKRSLYEGGVRVPFILRWPAAGSSPGRVDDDTPLCAVDLLPTFCDLAGIDLPDDLVLDGESMAAAFRGQSQRRNTPLMWEWRFHIHGHTLNRSPMLAIREGPWKLLLNPQKDRVELYHIPNDPTELTNLAATHPELVQQLSNTVLAWQKTLPDGPLDATAGSNAYPWPRH